MMMMKTCRNVLPSPALPRTLWCWQMTWSRLRSWAGERMEWWTRWDTCPAASLWLWRWAGEERPLPTAQTTGLQCQFFVIVVVNREKLMKGIDIFANKERPDAIGAHFLCEFKWQFYFTWRRYWRLLRCFFSLCRGFAPQSTLWSRRGSWWTWIFACGRWTASTLWPSMAPSSGRSVSVSLQCRLSFDWTVSHLYLLL